MSLSRALVVIFAASFFLAVWSLISLFNSTSSGAAAEAPVLSSRVRTADVRNANREVPRNSSGARNKTSGSSNWRYEVTTDKMRGATEKFATTYSSNTLSLNFPYQGGKARLTLRDRPKDGLNVMLFIN